MTLPQIVAEGGLVAIPELRFSNSGNPWASLRIACKDRVRGQSGEWTDGPTTFIDVVVFGRAAENLIESADKGDTIVVVGKLQQREWEAEDGTKRSSYSIKADTVAVSINWNKAVTPRLSDSMTTAGAKRMVTDAGMPERERDVNKRDDWPF